MGPAGVVDPDIHPAKVLQGALPKGLYLLIVGYIARLTQNPLPVVVDCQPIDGRRHPIRGAAADDDLAALG